MTALVGKTIAGYILEEARGRGPIGERFVASADDASTNGGQARRAIVLLIHGRLSLMDRVQLMEEDLERLESLAHPHIALPQVTRWAKSGRFMMASESIDERGLSLEEAVAKRGQLAPRQVLRFAGQVCLALEAAHDNGVLHGALSPASVFLVPSGDGEFSTRVTDFASNHLLTTPIGEGYAAPELLDGTKTDLAQADRISADIYALGAVVYTALAGSPPASDGESAVPPAADTPAAEAIPPGLLDILTQATRRTADQRTPSVKALRQALEAWAASKPPELATPSVPLFEDGAKNTAAAGVADSKQNQELPKVASNDGNKQADGNDRSREEQELAAMAEQASAVLRGDQDSDDDEPGSADQGSAPANHSDKTVKTKTPAAVEQEPDEPVVTSAPTSKAPAATEADVAKLEADEIELPQERTVKAFVNTISPSVDDDSSSGNGESLELAFDQFVSEAKAVNTALPAPIVSDAQLAELAKAPVAAPEPKKPEPEPKKELPLPVAVPLVSPPPPQRKSPVPAMIGGLVIGGLLVFGGMKLLDKPQPTPPADEPTAGTTTPAAAGEPTAATGSQAAATTAADATVAQADAVAATAADTATAATAADAGAATAADTSTATASADTGAAPSAEPDAAAPAKPVVAAKKRKKRVRKKTRVKKPRVKRTKPVRKKKPATKKKKSDWVDPFSQ